LLGVGIIGRVCNQVLDKNHTGLISIRQVATDPILLPILLPKPLLIANDTEAISSTLLMKGFGIHFTYSRPSVKTHEWQPFPSDDTFHRNK